jgi:hypothetical protein
LLAEIFFGGAFGTENAYTGAVLPDFANVALNEEAGNIFSELNGGEKVGVGPLDRWATRVVLRIADATDSLIFLLLEVVASICHVKIVRPGSLFGIVVVIAFSPATEEGVVEILKGFRRQ